MQVDVIIPTYKRYDILQETLASVQKQTYQNFICWIAEDGETPKTYGAVQPFLTDKRFIYLPGPHSGSPAAPRNRAMKKGTGSLLAFLDDDDLWLPHKLATQVAFMQDHQPCALLGCNAFRWKEGTSRSDNMPLYFDKKKCFGLIPYSSFVQDNHVILSSSMIRRSALEAAGFFNEKLPKLVVMAEDYEYWLRIGAVGEIWILEKPCLLYRETPLTYYRALSRREKYKSRELLYNAALAGDGTVPSPLSLPKYASRRAALLHEKNFYRKGPRFLGRLRHESLFKLKSSLGLTND